MIIGGVIVLTVAAFVGTLAALIYRGNTNLIAGYRRREGGDVNDTELGRWFGSGLFVLAAVTGAVGFVELRGDSSDTVWLGYTLVVITVAVWLSVGSRRFFPDSQGD